LVGTYLGLAIGRVPRLRVDRAGIVLVAATLLCILDVSLRATAMRAVSFETLAMLGALMLVSSQLEAAGLLHALGYEVARRGDSPKRLLLLVCIVVGALSALLTNDVVVFVLTPVVLRAVIAQGLRPLPFALGMAAAANAGSAATTLGNPQNILIGQVGPLSLAAYAKVAWLPALVSVLLVWGVLVVVCRADLDVATSSERVETTKPLVDRVGAAKGLFALALIVTALLLSLSFLWILAAAAIVLVSRRHETRAVLARVDWPMLLLFFGLFIVTEAARPYATTAVGWLSRHGLSLHALIPLSVVSLLFSNTVGNVPFVALVLPIAPDRLATTLVPLGVLSTLAGNLLVVGSIANIIVIERAAEVGVKIGFRAHARVGIPITLLTMLASLGCLWAAQRVGI
jgi:Na+/H+ antiporter NhaD/arsenite permease-like protein